MIPETMSPPEADQTEIFIAEELLTYPDDLLGKKSALVVEFDENLPTLFKRMRATMAGSSLRDRNITAVGISAIQIDVELQASIVRLPGREEIWAVNPRIKEQSTETSLQREGCLSIPGINVPVWRSDEVVVEYQDVKGQLHLVAGGRIRSSGVAARDRSQQWSVDVGSYLKVLQEDCA
jgi:peptide deformylase